MDSNNGQILRNCKLIENVFLGQSCATVNNITSVSYSNVNWDDGNSFGNTHAKVQAGLRVKYHEKGIKILVSAFGATEHPTSHGQSAK